MTKHVMNRNYFKHKLKASVRWICRIMLIFGLSMTLSTVIIGYDTTTTIVSQSFSNLIHRTTSNKYSDARLFEQCSLKKRSDLNCKKLNMGDKMELLKATRYIKSQKNQSNCNLLNLAQDCSVLKSAHNYIIDRHEITQEELEFPLAFAVKMHTSPEQAEQLLRTIYRPHNIYCINVDKKAKAEVFDIMNMIGNCFENILIVKNRINTVYSSIYVVEAERTCMRLLSKSPVSWKYYITLTGQEFPLKTNFELVKILQKLNGSNDIESGNYANVTKTRYTKQHFIKDDKIIGSNLPKPLFIKTLQMRKGSAYGTLSRAFVEFVLSDDFADKFFEWLNGTFAPEETFLPTLQSLPWAPGGFGPESLKRSQSFLSRAVIWYRYGFTCHGHYARNVCVYGVGDLPWLVSSPKFVANKFNINSDFVVLDCLEEMLKNRMKENRLEHLNWHYYNTLPQVEYYSKMEPFNQSKKYLKAKKEIWFREHNITTKQIGI